MKTRVRLHGKSSNNDLQGHRNKKGSERPLGYPSETGGG